MRSLVLLTGTLVLLTTSARAFERRVVVPQGSSSSGPFTPGILVDGTLFASGQVGRDPKTGSIPAEFEAEVKQALDNAGAIVSAAGMSMQDVVSVQVYLTDMTLFERMNKVYMSVFEEPRPARTTVGVAKLVGTARIEITVTARK
jgi:2-iminobutanoate/2-iminopropanoate deaminase